MTNTFKIAMLSLHSCPLGPLGTKDTGGMSVYLSHLSRELGNRGHRVDLFTRRHDPREPEVLEPWPNVRLIHLPVGPARPIPKLDICSLTDDLAERIEAFRSAEGTSYHLVHSHYWLSGLVGRDLAQAWGRPHLVMFHTLAAVKNAAGTIDPEPAARLAGEGILAAGPARLVAATETEKKDLVNFYGADPARVGLVPGGVDLDFFQPRPRLEARKALKLGHDTPIVLYAGRLEAVKALDRALAAASLLRQKRPGLKLVLLGGDEPPQPEEVRLRRLAGELGLADTALFLGRRSQARLADWYNAADVFVLPSRQESFGLAALESLACGRPVVATPVGGLKTIIQDGRNGRLVPCGRPEDLSTALGFFLDHPVDPETVRATVADFSWGRVAEATLGEYHGSWREFHTGKG